jgi:hypothetical protein
MSFKQRVGNFFLLAGAIGLVIFAASVAAPADGYNIPAFVAGLLLFGLGLNFRLSKSAAPPHHAEPPGAMAHSKPAGKGGGVGPKPTVAGSIKKQGVVTTIVKGPPPKRTAPAPPRPGGGGGPPPHKR